MSSLLFDPWFYAVGIPAVILVGLSKGGFGGATAILGVPVMALAMSPLQAAAILLPIMIVMDLFSLWTWRGQQDNKTLVYMMPGALIGIALGWFLAAIVPTHFVRLMIGIIAAVFVLRWLWLKFQALEKATKPNFAKASFWSVLSGYTSFVAHAGGPPFQIYALPLNLAPNVYVSTSVFYFALVNGVKLVPYFALGQFDHANLMAALVLMPLAPIATFAGAWLVRRMRQEVFYPFIYAMVAIIAIKLIYDGLSGL